MEIKLKTADEFRDAHVTIEIRAADQHGAQRVFDGLGARLYTAEEVGDFQASEAELVAAPLREAIRVLERKVVEYNRDRTTERDRADRNMTRAQEAEAEVERLKKGHVCTASCKPNAHVAFVGRQRLDELELALHDETERADTAEKALEESRSLVARQGAQHDRTLRVRDAETEERVKRRDIVIRDLKRDLVHWKEQYNGREQARAGLEKRLAEALKGHNRLAAQISKIRGAVPSPEILAALEVLDLSDHHQTLANAVREVRRIVGSPESGTSQA